MVMLKILDKIIIKYYISTLEARVPIWSLSFKTVMKNNNILSKGGIKNES